MTLLQEHWPWPTDLHLTSVRHYMSVRLWNPRPPAIVRTSNGPILSETVSHLRPEIYDLPPTNLQHKDVPRPKRES